MCTPRRALRRFAAGAAFLSLVAVAGAAEPTVVVDGLSSPFGLAVREGPRGGVEVVVAETDAGCVTSVVLLGEERQAAVTLIEGLETAPACVRWSTDGVLLVASRSVLSYASQQPGLPATPLSVAEAESPPERLTSLAGNERFVFAVGDGRLWRTRRIAEELSELRAVGRGKNAIATTIDPRGYLVVLTQTPAGFALQSLDPDAPNSGGSTVAVAGLTGPTELTFGAVPRPSDPFLYALGRDGVYRIDSSLGPDGLLGAVATRVVAGNRLQAMAFGPDGALYVVKAGESTEGVVLRFAGEF